MAKPRDLRLLLYFVEIARAGSIRGAAGKLGLSPAVLSEALSELEAVVGVTLIRRTTRSMSLTQDGEEMLAHAAVSISEADRAMSVGEPVAATVRGTVRVTLPTEVAVGWFSPALKAFEAKYPEVRVEVEADDDIVALASSDLDVAIRTMFAEEPKSGKDICACLPLALVCAPEVLGDTAETLDARLQRIGIIGIGSKRRRGRSINVRRSDGTGVRTLRAPVRFAVNNQLVAHRFALEGFGCALLFRDGVASDLASGRLVPVEPDYVFGFVVCQALARDKYPSRQTQAFLSFLLAWAEAQTEKPTP